MLDLAPSLFERIQNLETNFITLAIITSLPMLVAMSPGCSVTAFTLTYSFLSK